jgi:hypothetical protein
MMKLLMALFMVIPALANAYSWEQTIDFNPAPLIAPTSSFSFSHDLTLPDSGFNVGIDTISDYHLTINLHNDQGQWDIVNIDQPGGLFSDGFALLYSWKSTSLTTADSYEGLLSLSDTGKLLITVRSLLGSFLLDSSALIASGERGISVSASNNVNAPEPASMALLMVGMFGIVVMRRGNRAD